MHFEHEYDTRSILPGIYPALNTRSYLKKLIYICAEYVEN